MFGQTFYHGHLRKYVTLFGTLFNDIWINREQNGNQYSSIKVPITYAPKDKLLTRVDADPNLNKPFSIVLPRMAFEMTTMNYDPARKLSTVKKGYAVQNALDPSGNKYVYNPVPYDFNFSLYIAVKNAEDGTRILEQILPYFTPDWTMTVNLIPEMNIKLDIPTVLTNVTSEDNYDTDYLTRRSIVWTLDFTMHGYVFGPVKKGGLITLSNTNFYTTLDQSLPPEERVTVVPGLLANGSPTTNAAASLDRSEISSNSNYDYIVTYTNVDTE